MQDDALRLNDAECEALLDRLFPGGVADTAVMAEMAPQGWERSPLLAVFHPSPQRVYEELVQVRRNVQSFFGRRPRGEPPPEPEPEPTLEEIRREHQDAPIYPEQELRELVGRCPVWMPSPLPGPK